MKSIESFILEKLKVTNSKPGDCTLEEFLVWYYFDNKHPIEDLTFEEFVEIETPYLSHNNFKLYSSIINFLLYFIHTLFR